jgi:hypothetical protein
MDEQIGAEVFKVGYASGLTRGRIDGINASVLIQGWEENYYYENLFYIKSMDHSPFSQPGDGGAIVIRSDGVVLGLVLAGSAWSTLVCPISRVLSGLNCELLL